MINKAQGDRRQGGGWREEKNGNRDTRGCREGRREREGNTEGGMVRKRLKEGHSYVPNLNKQ